MSNRAAKFVSAIFASFLAAAPFTTTSHSAANTADACAPGPKGTLAQGGHWYYRVDRATKRHCWYIGEEKDRTARTASRVSSSSATAANYAPPRQDADVPKSIADARAELPSPQARVEPDADVIGGQRAPQQAVNIENNQRAKPQDASPQRSLVASRWPESAGVNLSADAGPAIASPEPNPPSNSRAALPPALATVTLAAADTSSEKQFGSIQMLLIVIVGALSLAGLMGSAIYRLGGMRWNKRREIRPERRAIWDLAGNDRLSPAASTADDPKTRIADMIAQLSRSTTS
ncbi:MAG: hypothetical protein JWR80_9304 [Bradyrhizobium sp.]|nr:hypothetical protein [Bradyrhizobium sp.]